MADKEPKYAYIAERIRNIRTGLGLDQGPFANEIGVSPRTLIRYEKGATAPDLAIAKRIATVGKVTLDYVAGGVVVAVPELRVLTLHEARKTLTPQEIKDSWAELPLVGEAAAAGDPRLVPGDQVEDWMLAPRRWVKHERYACVRVRGRSMLPVLGDGDIVAVNHDRRDLRELRGKIVVFEVPQEGVTLKYGDLVEGLICLRAHNELEWPARCHKADQVKVIGAVEWAWRRFE